MSAFKNRKIRTRFAPSPTGYLHIGSLKTLLFAYIFAKQNNGDLILRIEDTDQSRKVEDALESLLKILNWVGLTPDEGVVMDKNQKIAQKGDFGPYIQSERLDIYQKYAQNLVDKNLAYPCFCSAERLEKLRQTQQANKQPTRYDGHCRNLLAKEVEVRIKAGEPHVIRMKVPVNREVGFDDLVRGWVKFNTKELDDQVIMKSDGFPTYHLAAVVDDHEMQISHVIRGEEWLSSTPKHILLYEFFDWEIPVFAHIPLILNQDRSKLSKRQNDVAVEDYQEQGYLPEALINFSALLGWNPGTDQEIFSLDGLIKEFSFDRVQKAGAIFNREKLDWINSIYIKKLSLEKFKELVLPYLKEKFSVLPDHLESILKLEQERIVKLSEVGDNVKFLFVDELSYDPAKLIWRKSDRETTVEVLELLVNQLKSYAKDWTKENLEADLRQLVIDNNLDNGTVFWPLRYALTGEDRSPTPFEVAEILGKERSLARLEEGKRKLEVLS